MSENMREVERAFTVILERFKTFRLRPKTIALFYKTMCQSILLHGVDSADMHNKIQKTKHTSKHSDKKTQSCSIHFTDQFIS